MECLWERLLLPLRNVLLHLAPLVVVPSSGGAQYAEGILSLMQMARTTVAGRDAEGCVFLILRF